MIEGLPHRIFSVHSNNGIAEGPNGDLFLAIGGTSDHGPEIYEFAAGIVDFDPSSHNYAMYASGLRNPYDLAFCRDGSLFATDNGPDRIESGLSFRPPDEVNLIIEGGNYGYPDIFGYPPSWSGSIGPVATLPMSGAATGIACYDSRRGGRYAFPDEYDGRLFVTLWGTLALDIENGRRLVMIGFVGEAGDSEPLLEDMVTDLGHPIDVIQSIEGDLLILDQGAGGIYRLRWTGG